MWIATFALTVFADLTVAVEVGMVLAALLFIRRVADTTTVTAVTDEYLRESYAHSLHNYTIPPYVRIFRVQGPLLFGATDKLRAISDDVTKLPEVIILRLRNMTALDGTGIRALEELAESLHQSGRHLILCGAKPQPSRLMDQADFHRHVGAENICASIRHALERARDLHEARAKTGASAA